MRVLSVNAWPMASFCPIGYMGEHLFNDPRFEVLELVSRDVPVYCEFTRRRIVDFNKPTLSLRAPQAAGRDLGNGRGSSRGSSPKYLLKAFAKTLMPLRMDSQMLAELRSFEPDVVYTQGYDIRILAFAYYAARRLGIPCVTHTLDWWFSDQPAIERLQRKALRDAISGSSVHLAGSPKMADWVEGEFHTTVLFVSNCYDASADFRNPAPRNIRDCGGVSYLYAGNLTPRRHDSLNVLSRHLRPEDRLVVYAPIEQAEDGGLDPRIEVHPAVPQSEMSSLYEHADVLVHVESFEEAAMSFARYSLSTKVAEYLATGKPIFYYGPKGVGVGDFFFRTGCAFAAYDEDEIPSAVAALLDSAGDPVRAQRSRDAFNDLFERDAVRERLASCLSGK